MKHYTIKINKNNNNSFNFRTNTSKSLDDLILSGLKKMNPFLSKTNDSTLDAMFIDAGLNIDNDHILIPNRDYGYLLKGNFDTEFTKSAKFLSKFTPKKKYILFDGTPIEFFEDEIQIGYNLIPLYKLTSPTYYNTFTTEIKNTIINIFITIRR